MLGLTLLHLTTAQKNIELRHGGATIGAHYGRLRIYQQMIRPLFPACWTGRRPHRVIHDGARERAKADCSRVAISCIHSRIA